MHHFKGNAIPAGQFHFNSSLVPAGICFLGPNLQNWECSAFRFGLRDKIWAAW